MRRLLAGLLACAALAACDRNVEEYVPGEEPRQPDLSKIFPEGAEKAARMDPDIQMPAPPDAASPAAAGSDAPPVRGVVRLGESVDVPPGGILFLIARPTAGGPPLAVKRIASPEFPFEFSLGPEDRMLQARPFEGPFELSARLDGDGDALSRSPGDLQGAAAGPHAPGATGVVIVLDSAVGSPAAPAAPAGDEALPIRGVVRVGVSRDAPSGGVLFVVARSTAGGPPLAVKRIESPEFPFEFSLGPEDRMIQARPFEGPLELTARLDGDGDALSRSPGDLQGTAPGTHSPGATGVAIVLDSVAE